MSEEQIEQDELNMHACMLPLMKLIDHMEHNKITPEVAEVYIIQRSPNWIWKLCRCLDKVRCCIQGTTPDELPSWMACIQKKLLDIRTQLNVQLFLTRLITHRPKVLPTSASFNTECESMNFV